LLILRIEADLIEAMNSALPVTAQRCLERLGLASATQLGAALLILRRHVRAGAPELEPLLEAAAAGALDDRDASRPTAEAAGPQTTGRDQSQTG
jgi:hypothetical protein